MDTIVVPVVRSAVGAKALELAKREAHTRGADLVLVGAAAATEDVGEDVAAVRSHLTELEKELTDEGLQCRSEWSVGGSFGQATIDAARKQNADLIVLGLRRRSPVGKALLGSYEQEILLDAPCPVLSVRAPLGSEPPPRSVD